MNVNIFLIALLFYAAGFSAAPTPSRGFLDFYNKVQTIPQRGKIPNKPAILTLTRRVASFPKVLQRRNFQTGWANLTASGFSLLADVTIDGQTFPLVIDTGSSDTWVPDSNVECVDPETGKAVNQSVCAFGSLFKGNASQMAIPDTIMNQSYFSGEFMTGPMYMLPAEIGGLAINQTQVSLVTSAFWLGDNVNAGLLGLSSPAATAAFNNKTGKPAIYNPVLTNMFEKGIADPFFSLAIEKATSGPAGYLVIGGLPPVAYDSRFTTVPIELSSEAFGEKFDYPIFTDYTVNVTGFSYNGTIGKNDIIPNLSMIVDSGTSANLVPNKVADKINALFTPAGKFNNATGSFEISCNATAPTVGIKIGNGTFGIDPATAIFEAEPGICLSGWVGGGDEKDPNAKFFLGDVFLKNVIAVFDVGATQMHFAARK